MAVGAILPVGESCPAGEDFLAPCRRYASRLRPRSLPRALACGQVPPLSHRCLLCAMQRRDRTADLGERRAHPWRLQKGSRARTSTAPRPRTAPPRRRGTAQTRPRAARPRAAPPRPRPGSPRHRPDRLPPRGRRSRPLPPGTTLAPRSAPPHAPPRPARGAPMRHSPRPRHRRRDRLPHPRGLGAHRRAAEPASNPVRPCNAPSCPGSTAILRAAEVGPCEATRSSSRAHA
jgi:hypothetical protein